MPPLPRSHPSRPSPLLLGGAVLAVLLGLAASESLAAPKSKNARSSRTRGTSSSGDPAAPAPSPEPTASPAKPEPVAPSATAATPASPESAPPPAAAPRPVPAARPAPVTTRPAEPSAKDSPGGPRIGVGPDLFLEGGRLQGEQDINTSRRDESFDYSSANFLSATLWLSAPVTSVSERLRVGAGVRLLGNVGAGGGRMFGFGLLNEVFALAEYGLPVADRTEFVLSARGGLSVLVPGQEFAEEIRRLQEQGVGVWSVPRVGWLVGPGVGARRRMTEHILLRADILAQVWQQYLFATNQDISGLRYSKSWNTLALRLGLSLGIEFGL